MENNNRRKSEGGTQTLTKENGIVNKGFENEEEEEKEGEKVHVGNGELRNNQTVVDLDNEENEEKASSKDDFGGVIYISKKDFDIENGNIVIADPYKRGSKVGSLGDDSDEKSEEEKVKSGWRKHGGILFAFLGSITVTLASLTVKVLDEFHPFTLGLYRFIFSTICTLPILFYYQFWRKDALFSSLLPFNVRDKQQWVLVAYLLAMSASSCGGFLFRFFSVQYLTVADGTVLGLSGAVFVVFMAHVFLGEKCTVMSILIALWTFSGVIIIARPPMLTGESEFNDDVLVGTMFGIAAMIGWSISVITLRKTRSIHFTVVVLVGNVWGIFQCLVLVFIVGAAKILPETLEEFLVLTAFVVFSYIGSVSLIFAMKYDSAVTYSLIRSGDILFAYFWQFLFLAVVPDSYSIIGAVIVMSGIFLSTFRKWVGLPGESKVKHMFRFLK